MKTHTVPIITNGPLCDETCPWLCDVWNGIGSAKCVLFRVDVLNMRRSGKHYGFKCCDECRHVTERARAVTD